MPTPSPVVSVVDTLLYCKLLLFLLEQDLNAGTAAWTTEPSENGSRQLLGCLEIVERLAANVDADDVAGSFGHDARIWHDTCPSSIGPKRGTSTILSRQSIGECELHHICRSFRKPGMKERRK
jgi:hypothetical protein